MKIENYEFDYVATINECVKRDEDGMIYGYNPKDAYDNIKGLALNKYGNSTFCDFGIPSKSQNSGVYALFIDDLEVPVYIGRAANFDSRWSATNYAHISPRNCYKGGQSTNCHINSFIYKLIKENRLVKLYFFETPDYVKIEKELIRKYRPEYNTQLN